MVTATARHSSKAGPSKASSSEAGRPGVRAGVLPDAPHRSRSGWVGLVAGLVIGALVTALVLIVARQPDAVAIQTAEITAQDAVRDAAQVTELTALAERTRDDLLAVAQGLATALPSTPGAERPLASASNVAGWAAATAKAAESFAHPPSGSTSTNVARGGLRAATQQLRSAVDVYSAALATNGVERDRLLTLAAQDRDNAVLTWSVAGTQLDVININAGHGHAHVFLPADPGAGALTPDDSPEGKQ